MIKFEIIYFRLTSMCSRDNIYNIGRRGGAFLLRVLRESDYSFYLIWIMPAKGVSNGNPLLWQRVFYLSATRIIRRTWMYSDVKYGRRRVENYDKKF